MKLLIVRHGDPDYVNDTLTERGWDEIKLLTKRLTAMKIDECYVSPMGRAKDTASLTLKALNKTATEYDWLQEFPAALHINDSEALQKAFPDTRTDEHGFVPRIVWDCVPSYWTTRPEYFDRHLWRESEIAKKSNIVECYDYVTQNFDRFLAEHGYERCEDHYKAVRPNRDTIALFCHFGLQCVLLSHLMNVSPFILWHNTAMAPSSVSTIYTEEREQGCVTFRAAQIGDVSHLYAGGMEPSFAARFCETYDDWSERH